MSNASVEPESEGSMELERKVDPDDKKASNNESEVKLRLEEGGEIFHMQRKQQWM